MVLREWSDWPGKKFGLHEIMRCGVKFDKFPGEWFGPTTGCRVVAACLGGVDGEVYGGGEGIEVIVVDEGTVYVDQVEERMKAEEDEEEKKRKAMQPDPNSDYDPLHNPPPPLPSSLAPWPKSLLLLVPLRLGVSKIDPSFRTNLTKYFSLPQCLGILGGTPRHAIYFYGCSEDGKVLYGKDPHYTQFTPGKEWDETLGREEVVLSREYRRSIHGSSVSSKLSGIDPSLALAFYCDSREEWLGLVRDGFKGGICLSSKETGDGSNPLFSVQDVRPDFGGDIGNMDALLGGVGDDEGVESDGEGDYVFL
ncbi:hypothetical protein TL16_g07747, partial [Triparma laevis f. inornata]